MKFHLKNCSFPEKGFTLFELLIAMALTALIGAVLFQTWSMVAHSGAEAAKIVGAREGERIVFSLMDNDFTGMIFPGEETSNLPFPSKQPIELSGEFYEAMGKKKERKAKNGRKTLISFAGSTSLASDIASPGWPVCIEYVLEKNGAAYNLIRRERQTCGISGDFPWQENALLENIVDAQVELIFENGRRLAEWDARDLKIPPVALRLGWKSDNNSEKEILFPIFPWRVEVEWEE